MKKLLTKIMPILFLFTLVLGAFSGCVPNVQKQTKDIVVLYTGDVHCAVEGKIGYDGLAAYKNSFEDADVILVDTGDAIQGGPFGSFSEGENIIKLMNKVGYDAMALGNHEFDYGGPSRLKELQEIANFPFLSLNLTDTRTNTQPFLPYTIIEKSGAKVAFVGISTPETLTSSTPTYFMDENNQFVYDFLGDETGEKLYKAVQTTVDKARSEGANYVIAMTHMGIEYSSEPFTSSSLIVNTSGIDVVLDGHSHSVIECQRVKNKAGNIVLLTSTGSKLDNIGLLYIEKDGNLSTGLVSSYDKKDSEITQMIAEIKSDYSEMLNTQIGTLNNDLTAIDYEKELYLVRMMETNLGDFCADAYKQAGNADIAFVNGGGIRTDLKAGTVTYGDMLNIHPFGNLLCKVKVKGSVISDVLEYSVSQYPTPDGGFLQVSGVTFEFDATMPSSVVVDKNDMFVGVEGQRRVSNIKVNGEPLDLDKEYTVVSINYILKNFGNGYSMFKDAELIMDEFMLDVDALVKYMNDGYQENASKYAKKFGEGRIIAKLANA